MFDIFENIQELFDTFCKQADDFIEKQKENKE